VAGLSRSAFAARFSQVVGQTPMRYVFEYPMRCAARVLTAGGGATVASVARTVDYGSEGAFWAAFVRYAGRPPGAYRRTAALLGGRDPR
jgi:AraC-like DNA-binding protein